MPENVSRNNYTYEEVCGCLIYCLLNARYPRSPPSPPKRTPASPPPLHEPRPARYFRPNTMPKYSVDVVIWLTACIVIFACRLQLDWNSDTF